MKSELRYRQIHLDFHTSEHIENVGSDFDPDQFAGTLEEGNVDSVTLFARGHHGWAYYPSKIAAPHPNLKRPDLLGDMIEACRKRDINTPVYITVQWDERTAREHPEWRVIKAEGKRGTEDMDQFQAVWHTICLNNPEYLDYISAQALEIMDLYNPSGFFFDILTPWQCVCPKCLQSMNEKGLDPEKRQDRLMNDRDIIMNYYRRITGAVWDKDSDMRVFHNSGHVYRGERDRWEFFSHLELESLPTGGWGYDHFPMSAKYCEKLPLDFLGMTGKFHTTWGEFGGYKHPNALRYECAAMIAYGAKCSVGDQLHPNGELDESTYKLIGEAYADVERKEPWCVDTRNIADIGLLSAESIGAGRDNSADVGANRALLENHILYDVIDADMDFSCYRALILPDAIEIDAELKAKLDAYVEAGGRLLLTGASGVSESGDGFLFDVGAETEGEGEYEPDYILPREDLRPSFVDSPLVMYIKARRIRVTDGEALGDIFEPYFNRNFRHFCSHQHTPPRPEASGYACGVRKGGVIYLAHPVFSIYAGYGAVAYKEYLRRVLRLLLDDAPSVETNLPSTSRIALRNQPAQDRHILHLLHADKINRGGPVKLSGGNLSASGRSIEVIDELRPVHDTEIAVRLPEKITRVTLEPEGRELSFSANDGHIKIHLDQFTCHAMLVLHK
ncbi:MAG: alpha-amylase family protein [bacterium]